MRRDGNNTTGNEVETPAWPYRDCYNLNYPKRGLALVFAMKSFSGRAGKRGSAKKDLTNMKNTFTDLGFRVKPYLNLKTEKMREKLEKGDYIFSRHLHYF